MSSNVDGLRAIADRAKHYVERGSLLAEADTKAALIVPLLEWLGWDTRDPDEVRHEWRRRKQEEPVDYGMFINDHPVLLVEAKRIRDPLRNERGWRQIVANAVTANFRWCVRTNGRRVILFDLFHQTELEDKVVVDVDLALIDEAGGMHLADVASALSLISRESLESGKTAEAWQAQLTERAAREAVDAFFAKPPATLIEMIRAGSPDASIPDDLIARCISERIGAGPLRPQPAKPVPEPKPASARAPRITIADLMAAGVAKPGDLWSLSTAGKTVEGEVTSDGGFLVDGVRYLSPSVAGQRVTGWKSCDGWKLWKYTAADGTTKPIDELRKKLGGGREPRNRTKSKPTSEAVAQTGVDARLEGRPQCRALFDALIKCVKEHVEQFSVGANSKHITVSGSSVFMAISVRKDYLRFGLRLDPVVAESHQRLSVQPNGVYEGWHALHVSAEIRHQSEIDAELMGIIKRAAEAGGAVVR